VCAPALSPPLLPPPATGARVGSVPSLGAAATSAALDAAAAAQPSWAASHPRVRSTVLRAWHDLLLANTDDLALLLTSEQGKPLAEARAEIASAAEYLLWFSEEAPRAYGEVIPAPTPRHRGFTLRTPLGVACAITPWNFPSSMLARKAGAALAAGCTLVAKPSELTPLSALAFAALGERAGLPRGVLSVVTGAHAAEIGGAMTAHAATRKLSFTGSTAVGKTLQAQCAPRLIRTSMELGGNAPFIVLPDADIEAAAAGAVAAKFRNAGQARAHARTHTQKRASKPRSPLPFSPPFLPPFQTCICPNRFYVHADVYDAFATALGARMDAALRVGNGADAGVTLGPLINGAALAKCERHVADALRRGASAARGGDGASASVSGGRFFAPTLLLNVPCDALLCREETFGPVAALVRVRSAEEALAEANGASAAGLAAYVYGRDGAATLAVAEALQAGMVGVNTPFVSAVPAPFGGVRDSGHGREGSLHGIGEYMDVRAWHRGRADARLRGCAMRMRARVCVCVCAFLRMCAHARVREAVLTQQACVCASSVFCAD
jgi:succinate-semialdehyde dehydrogenase/glutarate-semialdehyde dehydrogenase